jgi:predicted ester cyclase
LHIGVPIFDIRAMTMLPGRDIRISGTCFDRIRQYYDCFNERRFADAAAMFADDAVLEQVPFNCRERGGAAYRLFADTWTRAFPDASVTIEEIVERPGGVFEIDLRVTGTHQGDLAMGGCVFKPTGAAMTLRLRELVEFRGERIAMSCLSFDMQELAHQLSSIDETQLLMHLSRLRYLEEQLRGTSPDFPRRRDLLERIGRELDAGRRVVRPYFTR